MIIRVMKLADVEVETDDPIEGMNMANELDSEGALEFSNYYYDAATGDQIN